MKIWLSVLLLELLYYCHICCALSKHYDMELSTILTCYCLQWFQFIVSLIASICLKMLGWHPFHKDSLQLLYSSPRVVLLTENESWSECFIGYLYSLTLSDDHSYWCYLCSETTYKRLRYIKWILKLLHIVPDSIDLSSHLPHKVMNQTQQLVMVTSLTNATKRGRWFEIAQNLDCEIGCIGINYHPFIRTVHCGSGKFVEACMINEFTALDTIKQSLPSIYNKQLQERSLQEHIKVITPRNSFFRSLLFTKDTPVSYQPHSSAVHFVVVDLLCVTSCLFIIPAFAALHLQMWSFTICTLSVMWSTWCYHYYYEQTQCWNASRMFLACWYLVFLSSIIRCESIEVGWKIMYILMLIGSLFLYIPSFVRHRKWFRTMPYVLFQSLWYTVLCLLMLGFCGHLWSMEQYTV